jgi:hypothetical protein
MSRVNLGAAAVRKATRKRQIAQEKASKKAFEKRRKADRKTAEKRHSAAVAERKATRKRQIAQEEALGHKVGALDKAFLAGRRKQSVYKLPRRSKTDERIGILNRVKYGTTRK